MVSIKSAGERFIESLTMLASIFVQRCAPSEIRPGATSQELRRPVSALSEAGNNDDNFARC
jgi:hypothetical protein